MKTIISGIVGSTAYGLAGPNSDTDMLHVYVAPLNEVLGLNRDEIIDSSVQKHDPDSTWHEVGKYLRLILKCNPTALELLWLESYNILEWEGELLRQNREHFLGSKLVRDAYGGYAKQQLFRIGTSLKDERLNSPPMRARVAKHARHTMRLLMQGAQLLSTGTMTVNVGSKREWIMEAGQLAAEDYPKFELMFNEVYSNFQALDTVLPPEPNRELGNEILVRIRRKEIDALLSQRDNQPTADEVADGGDSDGGSGRSEIPSGSVQLPWEGRIGSV